MKLHIRRHEKTQALWFIELETISSIGKVRYLDSNLESGWMFLYDILTYTRPAHPQEYAGTLSRMLHLYPNIQLTDANGRIEDETITIQQCIKANDNVGKALRRVNNCS